MLRKLNLIPLLLLPALTAYFVIQEGIVVPPWIQERYTLETLPPVESFQIQSDATGSIYTIDVQVPHGYAESDKRYPVFYALDGRPAIGLYDEMVLPLLRRRDIPETIFVGVNFPSPPRGGDAAGSDMPRQGLFGPRATQRMRQLTLHPDDTYGPKGSGDTAIFLQFLEEELIPRIDEQFRTIPGDRGLGGYEIAGLFVVRATVTQPGLFPRAIAIAPSLHWADYAIIEDVRQSMPYPETAPARLYVAVGGNDWPAYVQGWELLRDVMQRSDTGALRFRPEQFPVRDHETAIVPAAQSGLTWVYRDF